jgi:hypothetical protein
MEFKNPSGAYCARCRACSARLNEYGLCAKCWCELDDEQRRALTGEAAERIVTYRIPAQPGFVKRVLSSAVGTFVGAAVALAAARLLGWL